MSLLISTVLLTGFVTRTLPQDSGLYSRQPVVASEEGVRVTWVLQGSGVSLRCEVNTSRCGQYHNVKGRLENCWNNFIIGSFSS